MLINGLDGHDTLADINTMFPKIFTALKKTCAFFNEIESGVNYIFLMMHKSSLDLLILTMIQQRQIYLLESALSLIYVRNRVHNKKGAR